MKYQVLGPVAALGTEREIPLQQKGQALLAVLVMELGRPVPRQRLMEIIWDEPEPVGRETRLIRIVSELRQHLRALDPEVVDPLPDVGDAYRLLMHQEEADVHRFRAKASKAKTLNGDAAVRMMSDALAEWTEGHGLYGRPLVGVRSTWADSNREKLRAEHRDAHLFRLEHIARNGGHEQVAEECRMLDDNAESLLDESFVAMWMITAYRTGGSNAPLGVFRRAEERFRHALDRPVGRPLTELARRIEAHDPELAGPQGTALARLQPPSSAGARRINSITAQTKETTTMGEQHDRPVFDNDNSVIAAQAGEFNEKVVINLGGVSQVTSPEQAEKPENDQDDTDGQAS
ncbi:AfsR/SARP family transcriptional regulator [Spirillospora sp. CA-108201]